MCYSHRQNAGSNMSHGPPTGHFSHTASKRLATNKLPGKTSGLDHVDILQTATAPMAFWDALLETTTCGRLVAPVVGAIA